jgi:benzoylformate decarboxylase
VTGADRLLAALADAGVEVVFGNPGSTELPLIDAFPRQGRVRYVLGLHEAAVMGIADGYAQQGDRLAVVNVHVQPGLANALSGVLNAARARVPMLVTVGQQVTGLLESGPFLGGDVVAMARPVAKAAWEVVRPADLAPSVARAVAVATAHPRGPVVLSLPMDVLAAPATDGGATPSAEPAVATADRLVHDAVGLLTRAESPVLLAGDGVVHEDAAGDLLTIAERVGAPVWGEPFAARTPVPAAHPLWRGPLPGFAAEIAPRLAGHDVVLAVGMPVFRLFGDSPGPALAPGTGLIHVDPDPAEVGRSIPTDVAMPIRVAPALRALLASLPAPGPGVEARRARVVAAIAAERRDAAERLRDMAAAPGITPAVLSVAIAEAVRRDDLVVDEALTSGRWLRVALGGRNDARNWLAHRGSALGWGLPAAVGAKLADPGRRVLCVHGDGGFLFGAHALWTAARERVGVAVVVADNGGYEILRAGLEGMTGRPSGPWPGLAIDDPPVDVAAIARGFGASAERLEPGGRLGEALERLWRRAEHGPAVLVVPVAGRTPPVGYPLAS